MRWLTESAMHRRRAMISADWKKKRGDSIGAAPVRPQISERRKARQGYGLYPTRYDDRGLAGDGLHGRNGALADQCDGHRVGTHAVECDAAGGVGGAEDGR